MASPHAMLASRVKRFCRRSPPSRAPRGWAAVRQEAPDMRLKTNSSRRTMAARAAPFPVVDPSIEPQRMAELERFMQGTGSFRSTTEQRATVMEAIAASRTSWQPRSPIRTMGIGSIHDSAHCLRTQRTPFMGAGSYSPSGMNLGLTDGLAHARGRRRLRRGFPFRLCVAA